jgi:predicted molibdopterin-dependent oxidoreductase YjgC
MKHSYTICPHCGCGCGLYIVEQDGAVSGVTASLGHALGQGQLCARGWTCHQMIRSTVRLKSAMMGEPGKLSPAGWEEAVDRAAEMLVKVRDSHGTGSVGVIGSSRLTEAEAWCLRSLAESGLNTPHYDSGARLGWLPLGLPNPARHQDIDEADLIMVTGADLLEENPILGARVMSRCKPAADRPYVSPDISHQIPKDPGILVLGNSRPSDLRNAASIMIQPRPGREWVLLAAMLQKLAKSSVCRSKGFDKLKESLGKVQIDRLLNYAGIAPGDAARAASLLEKSVKPLLIVGRGLWQTEQAGAARAAVIDLALTVEKLKVMQAAAGANDTGCGQILSSDRGLGYMEMIEAASAGKLKALVLVGEDPLRSLPGPELTAKALAGVEALVVIDSFAANLVIPLAKVVLPLPLPLEKSGAFRNIAGESQNFDSVLAAPAGVRGLEEILSRWAKTLGGKISGSGRAEAAAENEISWLEIPETTSKVDGFLLELGTAYPHLAGGELYTEATPHLAREFAGGWAEMHPEDISELGLRAGWRARLATEAGRMEAVIRPNPGLSRKTIFMPAHFRGNTLAPFRFHPALKTPILKGIPAKVEKIS